MMYNDYGYKGSLSEFTNSSKCIWDQTPTGSISFNSGTNDSIKSDFYLNCKKEVNNMSIAYAQILKDGIILLADSRSRNISNYTVKYDDNYQKIAYSVKFRSGLALTGLCEFGDKDFVEYVHEVEKRTNDYNEFVNKLISGFSFYSLLNDSIVNFCIANYINTDYDENAPVLRLLDFSKNGIINDVTHRSVSNVFSMGCWGKAFFTENNFLADPLTAKNQIQLIKSKMQALIEFSTKHSNEKMSFIGGEVKALLLHPDGTAEWV